MFFFSILFPRTNTQNSTATANKNIPCLIPGGAAQPSQQSNEDLMPSTWNIFDVAQFLRINDCAAHCETFTKQKIDGQRLLDLTNDEIVKMLSMKVGPALKIYDLIQQLKLKMKGSRNSLGKSNVTKKYL